MANTNILIVENESIIAMELEDRLSQLGYTVAGTVASAQAAFKHIEKKRPDIILMDIRIQGAKDGIETAEEVRSRFGIPVIYLTAHADEATMQRAKVTEPFGYLLKPFREQELRAAIEMALYKQEMENRLRASEARSKALLNANPDLMFLLDREGTYLDFHASNPALLVASPEQILGKKIKDIFPAELTQRFINAIENALDHDREEIAEYQLMLNDEQHYFEARIVPCTEQTVLSLVRDITERKQAEEELRESWARFGGVVNTAFDAIISVDEDQKIVLFNASAERVFGWTANELIGQPLDLLLPPESINPYQGFVNHYGTSRKDTSRLMNARREVRARRRDGSLFPVEVAISKITIKGGNIYTAILRDITERKQAEAALVEKEGRYRTLFDLSPSGIVLLDLEGNIVDVNKSFCQSLGYSVDELIGRSVHMLAAPEHLPNVDDDIALLQQTDRRYEHVVKDIHKDGTIRLMELRESLISLPDGRQGIVVVANDITERRETEIKLQESEASYRGLFNSVQDAIYVQAQDGRFLDVNQGAVEMYGYPREWFINKTPLDVAAPGMNDMKQIIAKVQKAFAGETQQFEFWGQRANGESFPKDVRLFKGNYFSEQVIIALSQDITERKRAEEALQAAETKYRALVEQSPAFIYMDKADETSKSIYVSPQITFLLGYAPADFIQDPALWHRLVYPEDYQRAIDSVEITLAQGRAVEEYRMIARDGRVVWVRDTSVLIHDQNGSPEFIQGFREDITARKETEIKLHEASQVLETVFEHTHLMLAYMDAEFNFIRVNRAYANADNKSPEYFPGKNHFELYPSAENEAIFRHVVESGEWYAVYAKPFEYKNSKEQGVSYWDWVVVPVKDTENKVTGVILSLQNVTERIQAEEERTRLVAILEATPDFVATADANGKILYYNRAARKMLGIGANEDISGIHIIDTHPQWAREIVQKRLLPSVMLDGVWSGETAFLSRDGREIPVSQVALAHKTPGGQIEFLSTIARDITEQKKAEETILKRAAELVTVAEISTAASTILDIDILLQTTVDLTKERFKLYHAQVYLLRETDNTLTLAAGAGEIGRQMSANGHSIPLTAKQSLVARAARTQQSVIANDVTQAADFLPNPLLPQTTAELAVPLIYGSQLLGVLDVQCMQTNRFSEEDINIQSTLAAQVATAIQNTRQYQQILSAAANLKGIQNAINAGAIVSITDVNGNIEFANENFAKISKHSLEELIGKNHRIVKSGYHSTEFFRSMWKTIASGKTWRGEICNRAKDGSFYWVDASISPILDEHGKPIKYIAVRFDITERKKAEDNLLTRTRELETLYSISTKLRSARTSDEILLLVLNEMHRLLNTDASSILLLDEEGTHLTYALGSGTLAPNKARQITLDKSISGQVLRTGQPYITEDLANDPQKALGLLGADELGPAVFVPLQSETEVLGTLVVAREKYSPARAFPPAEVQLLSTIGEMVGNALRRTGLFNEALRRLERMQALHNIDLAITSSLDPLQILHILLIETISQLKVDAADVLLINPDTHKLEYRAGRGFRTNIIGTSLAIGEGYAGRAALEHRTLTVQNISQDHDFTRTFVVEEGFKSYICAPLITKGEVIGVLEIFQRSPFTASREWMDYLTTLAIQAAISIDNATLFKSLQRSNFELTHAYDATIEGWSRALDLREHETERHTARVMDMTIKLAKTMGIPDEEIVHIRRGALLHDIGKMGIPDSILLKTSNLTEDEWKIMRMHPQYAYEMLKPIHYLTPALDIPHHHHERWDGTGYPHGLKGEEIPLVARIFAVCDVWDAVTSDRPYRKAWSKKEALKYVRAQAGSHFDPKVVSIFQNLIKNEK
jgi:PAS domain S-box-containing protein